jgi:hypothetical protein
MFPDYALYTSSSYTSGLYYKHIAIVNDDPSIINKWWVSHTDDTRVIIYNRNMFIIQATENKGAMITTSGAGTSTCDLFYKHSMIILGDDRKWCLNYKYGIGLALARVIN